MFFIDMCSAVNLVGSADLTWSMEAGESSNLVSSCEKLKGRCPFTSHLILSFSY